MAAHLPQTPDEFLDIVGVGKHKATQFGDTFLEVIRTHTKGSVCEQPLEWNAAEEADQEIGTEISLPPVTGKPTSSTPKERYTLALAGFQSGMSLYKVADLCGVRPRTVLDYLYHMYKKDQEQFTQLVLPKAQLPAAIREQIFALFVENGIDALGPTYWAMDERVEYVDLALLRLEYLQLQEQVALE
jgi:hypothetical protein